jgi:hypothetical protein
VNTWARKSFKVGALSAGALLFAGTAANADFNSAGNSGVLSGNQINATLQAPIDVCGNAIGIVGNASAACRGGSWADLGSDSSPRFNSIGNSGLASGNQINATVQAPIDVCGNAVGVFGNARAACVGGSSAKIGSKNSSDRWHSDHKQRNQGRVKTASHVRTESAQASAPGGPTLNSIGNSGVGSGNQLNAVIQAPIDVCGNAVGVVGNAIARCVGGAAASVGGRSDGWDGRDGNGRDASEDGYGHDGDHKDCRHDDKANSPTLNSIGNSGILSGNQLNVLVQAPIDIINNAISGIGNGGGGGGGGNDGGGGGGGNN